MLYIRAAMGILEPPAPVLLNVWKHHGRAVRSRIDAVADRGAYALPVLAEQLVVVGNRLMDFYVGPLWPGEIARAVTAKLDAMGVLEPSAFQPWVESAGGYQMLELDADGSMWALRHGHAGERYVHVHPARWAPLTYRVRANVVKTAIMAMAHAGVHGGDPSDVVVVNDARRLYLGLSAVEAIDVTEGIGLLIDAMKKLGGC